MMSKKDRLLALAKAHRAQGHEAAAKKLEAKAAKASGKSRSKNPSHKKARKPRASAAAPAAPSKKGKGKGKKKPSGLAIVVRTTTRKSKDGKTHKKMKASVAKLRKAAGRGAAFINLRTGAIMTQKQVRAGRSKNPSLGGGELATLALFVPVGASLAEITSRAFATMPKTYTPGVDEKAPPVLYGRPAATRIAIRRMGAALWGPAAIGAASGALGLAALGAMPMLGAALLGVGLGHLGWFGATVVVQRLLPARDAEKASWGNRIAPEYQENVQQALASQVATDTANNVGGYDKEGTIVLDAREFAPGKLEAPWNLTPARGGPEKAKGETPEPTGTELPAKAPPAVSGVASARRALQQARAKLAAAGQANTPVPAAVPPALAAARAAALSGQGAVADKAYTEAFGLAAHGKDKGCGGCDDEHPCDECAEQKKYGSPAGPANASPPSGSPAMPAAESPHGTPAGVQPPERPLPVAPVYQGTPDRPGYALIPKDPVTAEPVIGKTPLALPDPRRHTSPWGNLKPRRKIAA